MSKDEKLGEYWKSTTTGTVPASMQSKKFRAVSKENRRKNMPAIPFHAECEDLSIQNARFCKILNSIAIYCIPWALSTSLYFLLTTSILHFLIVSIRLWNKSDIGVPLGLVGDGKFAVFCFRIVRYMWFIYPFKLTQRPVNVVERIAFDQFHIIHVYLYR